MAGHALAAVQALHGVGGEAHVELAPGEGVRDGVVVPADLDVVVDVDPDLLPLGEHVALGGQRAKRGAVELLEQRAPRPRELAERARVEPLKELGNRSVELGQREQRAMTKRSQYPALDHLHAYFDLGLVARPSHPRRQHRDPVVAGQVVVGRVGVGLVAMRPAHRRAQIVGDDQLDTATEELERAHVRRNPVRQALRPRRLGIGVARRPEHRDEDLRLAQLPGVTVHHPHRVPGVVHEQLLARTVLLAHHHVEPRRPLPVLLAEPTVLQPLGMGRLVLLPHQRQRPPLQSYLQRVVNGGGRIEREYGLGRGRTDLLMLWPREAGQPSELWERFVVECKVLRDSARKSLAGTVEEGVKQTLGYMKKCGAEEGHMVVIDRRAGDGEGDEGVLARGSSAGRGSGSLDAVGLGIRWVQV